MTGLRNCVVDRHVRYVRRRIERHDMRATARAACAIASMISTPGITGLGKWPSKNGRCATRASGRDPFADLVDPGDEQERIAV
jgi:hypothetical protein